MNLSTNENTFGRGRDVPMKTLGHRSLASFLRVALRVVQILLYISVPFVAFGCGVALLKSYGAEIGWIDMPTPPSPILAWLFCGMIAVGLTVSIVVVSRLRSIFATLSAGDPFVPENATHLRVIAIALAAGEIARYAIGGAMMATMLALRIEP